MINLNNTLLLGHRGARGEAVENTSASFEHAQHLQARGLAGVEFDVQLSADGQLVVFHDDNLERMCGQQSHIDQLTLAEIKRYRQYGYPVMTLACAYDVLTNFRYIELEIKTHERTNYTQLVNALAHNLIDTPLASLPIVLTSFDVELHARLQRHPLLMHTPRGLLIRTPDALATAPNTALQLGCSRLGIHYPLLTQSVIKNSHRYGLPVSAWTVNDIDTIKSLITWQVDVIITDFPTHLLVH